MAGIYIHIPFCKQACHYCDFHFSTSLMLKQPLLNALKYEIIARKNELEGLTINTIYFGGGTPSILEIDEIKKIIEIIYSHYKISNNVEITLEANPDDLTKRKINELKTTEINRFSIGIQSFFNEDLQYMNRAHNAIQAESAVKTSQDAGFENITIDLIYGTPTLTNENWLTNLRKTISLQVPHLSCYALTVENDTPLFHLIKRNKLLLVDEETIANHFKIMTETLSKEGFEQYEISNFCKPGFQSMHNSSYWNGLPYLGLGPGAHSFNGEEKRRWNIANNAAYINSVTTNQKYFEEETLSQIDKYNEFIMTQIRLSKGISLAIITEKFGVDYHNHVINCLQKWDSSNYSIKNNCIILTFAGILLSDKLASELFLIN